DIGGIAAAGHLGGLLLRRRYALLDAQGCGFDLGFGVQVRSGRAIPAAPKVCSCNGWVRKKARGVDPPSGYCFRKPVFIDRLPETIRHPAALHIADAPKLVERAPACAVIA